MSATATSTPAHSSGIRAIVQVRHVDDNGVLVRVDGVDLGTVVMDSWVSLKSRTDRLAVFKLSNSVLYKGCMSDKLVLMYSMDSTYDLRTKLALVHVKVVLAKKRGETRNFLNTLRARNIEVRSEPGSAPTGTVFVPGAVTFYGRFSEAFCSCGGRKVLLQLRNGSMETTPLLCSRLCNIDDPRFLLRNYIVEPDPTVVHVNIQDTVSALTAVDSNTDSYVDVFGTVCLACRHCSACKRIRRRRNDTKATCGKHRGCVVDPLRKVCECVYTSKKHGGRRAFRLRRFNEAFF